MAFELPDGKTARTLPEQVRFLTDKLKEVIAAMGDMKMKIKVVDALPEEGEDMTIYFVPSSDPDLENVYKEFMWIDEQWEMIGSTAIDLTDYVTLDTEQTITAIKNLSADLIPSTDGGMKLGLPAKRFSDINTQGLSNDYGALQLAANGNIQFVFAGTNRAMVPNRDGQDDIGSPSVNFRDIYLVGSLKKGNDSADVADITALITYAKAQGWIQ